MPDDEVQLADIPESSSYLEPPPEKVKAEGANRVAQLLVWIFAGTIAVSLAGGFTMMALHPPPVSGSDDKANIIGSAVLPMLEGVGTFASTVFGPLLAFVLGYYFGEKKTT